MFVMELHHATWVVFVPALFMAYMLLSKLADGLEVTFFKLYSQGEAVETNTM